MCMQVVEEYLNFFFTKGFKRYWKMYGGNRKVSSDEIKGNILGKSNSPLNQTPFVWQLSSLYLGQFSQMCLLLFLTVIQGGSLRSLSKQKELLLMPWGTWFLLYLPSLGISHLSKAGSLDFQDLLFGRRGEGCCKKRQGENIAPWVEFLPHKHIKKSYTIFKMWKILGHPNPYGSSCKSTCIYMDCHKTYH